MTCRSRKGKAPPMALKARRRYTWIIKQVQAILQPRSVGVASRI